MNNTGLGTERIRGIARLSKRCLFSCLCSYLFLWLRYLGISFFLWVVHLPYKDQNVHKGFRAFMHDTRWLPPKTHTTRREYAEVSNQAGVSLKKKLKKKKLGAHKVGPACFTPSRLTSSTVFPCFLFREQPNNGLEDHTCLGRGRPYSILMS